MTVWGRVHTRGTYNNRDRWGMVDEGVEVVMKRPGGDDCVVKINIKECLNGLIK